MLYFTDLPAIKFSVAAEKLTHRLVPLPALSDAPGHAPNPPSCRPRPCQGFRQRQGGDAEGGGPIPSGAESVRPRAPTSPAGLGEERGFWSLSRPTRGRSTRPRPYGEVPRGGAEGRCRRRRGWCGVRLPAGRRVAAVRGSTCTLACWHIHTETRVF